MSTIFDLHASILADYRDFVRSFVLIADERARALVDAALGEIGGESQSEPLATRHSLLPSGPSRWCN